jgi:beta-N-acetylhexosaminidase
MELTKRIGQLFLLGFQGSSLHADHPMVADIRDRNLGGVILFDRLLAQKKKSNNILGATQLKQLNNSLQLLSPVPLLIAMDQEGGMVKRIKAETGFPETISAARLGTLDDPLLTALNASCTANTLHALGINYNLAPVVDLNLFPKNPVIGKIGRSFSGDPQCVIRHATTWIKEHTKRNILSCLKHFPGHGSSHTDSHLGFTDISKSWRESELLPFKELLSLDNGQFVHSVMLGHLFHKNLDPCHPTSLSYAVVTGLLRDTLGFKGVAISDDLQMRAITDKYGLEESVCLALAAGVDMLIIGNNLEYDPDFLKRAIPAVRQAVEDGRIGEARINEAWNRVTTMKSQLQIG